jgi:hypothetical protein
VALEIWWGCGCSLRAGGSPLALRLNSERILPFRHFEVEDPSVAVKRENYKELGLDTIDGFFEKNKSVAGADVTSSIGLVTDFSA